MFIESICSDEQVVLANIREVKLDSPDYLHTDPDKAAEDFRQRIQHYEEAYQSLDSVPNVESDYSYAKLINVGTHVFSIAYHIYFY